MNAPLENNASGEQHPRRRGIDPFDMHFPITPGRRYRKLATRSPRAVAYIYQNVSIVAPFAGLPSTGGRPAITRWYSPKRFQYASVPDGADVAVRTLCFGFFLERAERRIMP